MASQEQEHLAALEELVRQYQELNRLLPQQQAAASTAATGLTGFEKGLTIAGKAADGIASAFTSGMKAMYEGQKGMKAFGGAVDGAADALMALTGALALIGGPITLLAAGLTAAVAAGAKYVKAANEQSDKLYDAYQQMAQAGAAAGDGLQGLYNDVKRLGGGMQDLGDFVSLISSSSKDLASFSGTVSQGRKDFAKLSNEMKPYRESLMNAGLSQKEINEGTAAYIRLQSRVGLTQNRTMNELADSAHKYLMEQDQLTKLTGLTRKEQEDARQKARSRETFAATLVTLRAKGDKASLEAANKLEKTYTVLQQHSQELGDGFLDLTTGNLQSEAAQKLHIATQGEATRVANELKNGMISEGEALDRIREALKRNVDTYGASQGAMQNYNKTFGDLAGTVSFVSAGMKGFQKSIDAAGKTQKEQGLFGDDILDKEIKAQTELRLTQVNTMQNMQDFVRRGVGPATKATSFFGKVLEKTSKLFKGSDTLSAEYDAERAAEKAEEQVTAKYDAMLEAGAAVDAAVTDIEKEAANKKLETAKLEFKTAVEARNAAKDKLDELKSGKAPAAAPRQPAGRTEGQNMAGMAQRGGLTAKEAQTLLDANNERDIKAFGGRELLEKIAKGQQQAAPAPAQPTAPAPAPAPAQPPEAAAAMVGPSRGRRPKRGFTNEEAAKAAAKMDQPEPPPKAPVAAPAPPPKEEKKAEAPATGGALVKDPNPAPPPAPDKAAKPVTIGVAPGMSDDEIKKMIIKHEGVRLRPYRDSLGLWTVGVGHLIGDGKTLPPEWDREFSQEEVMAMFDKDYQEHKAAAAANVPKFDQMTGSGKAAFTDLTFNMGPNWLSRWPNTKKAIEEQNNMAIAMGLQDSKWFSQVGNRSATIVDLAKNSFPQAMDGGMFAGPKSGYPVTLHGPEAVVPLKDGSIPVNMNSDIIVESLQNIANDFKTALNQITDNLKQSSPEISEETLAVLRNIEQFARNSTDIQDKLLRVAQN